MSVGGIVATPHAGRGKGTHQTTTHPPEAAPESPQVIDEDKSVVTSCTQDSPDPISTWLQGVCDMLGMGPGDGSTTTDGDVMTPEGTAVAMSMGSRTTFGTPTVTGSGCSSDESTESQHGGHERTDGTNETIVSCSDGDLLLHIRYQGNQDATSETGTLILSLRVSSTVLRIASAPLKLLLDAPPVSKSQTLAGLPHLISIHEPRVWGCREGEDIVALILRVPNRSEQLRQAALIVFNILHLNKGYIPAETPSMLQIAWVAELAWVLGCLSPIVPWIQAWVAGCPVVDVDTRLVSAVFLGFIMGDSETFEQASLHWILRGSKRDFDTFEESSLGVMIVIHDSLQRKRQEAARDLMKTLNESLHSYCVHGKLRGDFDQTFVLGAIFSAICDPSAGITMTPMLDPAPHSGPPFRLQWQPHMDEESINSLLGKLVAIMEAFNVELQLNRRDLFSRWKNPVLSLATKVVTLRENMRGLTLGDYRPEVAELMNVRPYLADVTGETDKEMLQLRNYGAPTNVRRLTWHTWRMVAFFQFVFFVLLIIIYAGIQRGSKKSHTPPLETQTLHKYLEILQPKRIRNLLRVKLFAT